MTGRITADPFVETVKNGEAKALFAQVRFSHDGEVRTVQIFPGMGEDSWPCKGDIVTVEKVGGFWRASGIWDGAEPQREPGERELYSRNGGGEKQARHVFKGDGKHYIGNTVSDLCKVLNGIMDIIKGLQTAGSPGAHTVNPTYQAQIENYKNEIEKLLTGEA
jgi:hypothetical protein